MSNLGLFVAVFVACAVETTEAMTIVLAIGLSRGWRSVWIGVASSLAVLAAVVAIAGPAVSSLPVDSLRLLVGGLLFLFGLQWLRKAIMRASGLKALHDEDAIFQREKRAADAVGLPLGHRFDGYGFIVVFKGVLLEGLEVVLIVLTFGANQGNVELASAAAAAAVLLTATAAFAAMEPLSRVPENTLKFGVGVLLTSFGAFWGAEGTGVSWPIGESALIPIIAFTLVSSLALTALLRTPRANPDAGTAP